MNHQNFYNVVHIHESTLNFAISEWNVNQGIPRTRQYTDSAALPLSQTLQCHTEIEDDTLRE